MKRRGQAPAGKRSEIKVEVVPITGYKKITFICWVLISKTNKIAKGQMTVRSHSYDEALRQNRREPSSHFYDVKSAKDSFADHQIDDSAEHVRVFRFSGKSFPPFASRIERFSLKEEDMFI